MLSSVRLSSPLTALIPSNLTGTPTDCHVMSKEAYNESLKNRKSAPLYQKILESLGFLKNNQIPPIVAEDKKEFVIVNSLQPQQVLFLPTLLSVLSFISSLSRPLLST